MQKHGVMNWGNKRGFRSFNNTSEINLNKLEMVYEIPSTQE